MGHYRGLVDMDTHLCIMCNRRIYGLDEYVRHRRQNCSMRATSIYTQPTTATSSSHPTQQQQQESSSTASAAVTYEPFNFSESETRNPSTSGGKTSKTLSTSYELPYELEADVFFSSLQLQSVQSTSGGKTSSAHPTAPWTRQKFSQLQSAATTSDVPWINTASPHQSRDENFLKYAATAEETKKSYDTIFKPPTLEHESPEVTEEEEEDVDIDVEDDDEDDEDYDPAADLQTSEVKCKPNILRRFSPIVPASHTGGKWKPEQRPNMTVAQSQLPRYSPTWEDESDAYEGRHPPSEHTKGKWVPGSKLQRLEYKEEVELAKCVGTKQEYWCNICCRKLKGRLLYENHLKSSYHLKKSESELQLEKAIIKELPKEDINKSFEVVENKPVSSTTPAVSATDTKRTRRCTYFKCKLCKHVVLRHLIGKHLISHYHYRRMQMHPIVSLPLILNNIHAIVLQSPFQCRPCRFYTNTEDNFLLHWNSASHLGASKGPGHFWCSYCQFECEVNNQMRTHLLSADHKEVLLAINRSVPVCISKIERINCPKCNQAFRFNFELRRHILNSHIGMELTGTASDAYQSKFKCYSCPEVLTSRIALQRHERFKHFIDIFYCFICNLQFKTALQAKKHRKTVPHKQKSLAEKLNLSHTKERKELQKPGKRALSKEKCSLDDEPSTSAQARATLSLQMSTTPISLKCNKCPFTTPHKLELSMHCKREHINVQYFCIMCSKNYASAQELGAHTRICKPAITIAPEQVKIPAQIKQILTEKGDTIWQCDLCNFKSPLRSDVLFHRIFHYYVGVSKNDLLPCPICDKKFRKQSLRFHLHNHTKEKHFKCDICNATFARPNNLKDHIRNLHQTGNKHAEGAAPADNIPNTKTMDGVVKDFPCNACDKIFKKKYSLKMHHLIHHTSDALLAKKRPLYKCSHENCKYVCVIKSLLVAHLNSHSAESFKCTKKGCNYVGKSEVHLRRHVRATHMPIPEMNLYACKQCSFKTKINAHLQRHLLRHTGEKPFSCPYCNYRCNTWENVRKHILKTDKHAGKYVFECSKCQEQLKNPEPMLEHKHMAVFKTNSHREYQEHLRCVHQLKSDGFLYGLKTLP